MIIQHQVGAAVLSSRWVWTTVLTYDHPAPSGVHQVSELLSFPSVFQQEMRQRWVGTKFLHMVIRHSVDWGECVRWAGPSFGHEHAGQYPSQQQMKISWFRPEDLPEEEAPEGFILEGSAPKPQELQQQNHAAAEEDGVQEKQQVDQRKTHAHKVGQEEGQ
eukprot:1150614-Pelagomonas_calceolata.AAC.1